MSLRDRTLYTDRINRSGAATATEPARVGPTGGVRPASPAAILAPVIRGPVERPLVVDRPRSVMSREVIELKHRLHDRLVREIDPSRLTTDLTPEDARRAVEDAVLELLQA